jgi:hypothetical protein
VVSSLLYIYHLVDLLQRGRQNSVHSVHGVYTLFLFSGVLITMEYAQCVRIQLRGGRERRPDRVLVVVFRTSSFFLERRKRLVGIDSSSFLRLLVSLWAGPCLSGSLGFTLLTFSVLEPFFDWTTTLCGDKTLITLTGSLQRSFLNFFFSPLCVIGCLIRIKSST